MTLLVRGNFNVTAEEKTHVEGRALDYRNELVRLKAFNCCS